MLRILLSIVLSIWITQAPAETAWQPLPAAQAFALTAHLDADKQLIVIWKIAPGYFLYRNRLKFSPTSANKTKLGQILFPAGITQKDEIHGRYQVYSGNLTIKIPLPTNQQDKLSLVINYQGCSEHGFCYSPVRKVIDVDLARARPGQNLIDHAELLTPQEPIESQQDFAKNLFTGHGLFFILMSFLGLGLLLAFTPCVLPMVPILSGIIVGHHKKQSKAHAFSLSLAYVLGMAITYALAGVIIALIGRHIQAELQKTWVIILFSGLFVVLACSLLGFYQIRPPRRWQQRLNQLSQHQKGGTYLGVFLMGSISSLIVSPCVSPPLVGVLAYIAQTGDAWVGGLALLALGIGMGLPLLILGISAARLLPKAGPWMTTLERIMGFIMLAVAIWMLARVLSGPVILFLWSALIIALAVYLGFFSFSRGRWVRSISALLLVYGVILLIGAVLGNANPFNPWGQWQTTCVAQSGVSCSGFIELKNMSQLDTLLKKAATAHTPIVLDFYADWCTSCVRMERNVFTQSNVRKKLADFILLRANVTANNAFDQALFERYHVIAPPTLLFFNSKGAELIKQRLVGEVSANELVEKLTKIKEMERGN